MYDVQCMIKKKLTMYNEQLTIDNGPLTFHFISYKLKIRNS